MLELLLPLAIGLVSAAAAREALEPSVSNGEAYRVSGGAMVELLAGVPALDVRTRETATAAGVPPPSAPTASAAP